MASKLKSDISGIDVFSEATDVGNGIRQEIVLKRPDGIDPFVGLPTAAPSAIAVNSAASTNATSIKASAGRLYELSCSNAGAAAAFVKLYNKASAPTVGTDVPVLTIPIPASGVVTMNLGATGHPFTTGIALAITNLVADTDTTAVAASQVKVLGAYV